MRSSSTSTTTPDRSKAVQDVKEQCCARLGANFLFIGTGQNALSGTALLQRLQGRFPVTVELQDTDVEQVTREVVLKKKPTAEPALKRLLDEHSGEIERQLSGTKIAFASRDRALLAQDYPILPVRRRFWERVLRAVDKAGTGAQLRNQLWVVYDAVKQTAEWPLGHVVGGAFIYDASIKSSALKSGTLLQEISETIARQKQEEDGELRYQLCALIFLIGQLPHNNEPLDAGIRADAETLADLLVTDLTRSSAGLRKKVPELLEALVASGAIMQVEDEYRMQTREGSEWNQAYLKAKNLLLNDAAKLASERSQLLRTQCSEALKKVKLTHGTSKTPRKIELHFGDIAPQADGSAIPVWVRDGWEVEEKVVLERRPRRGRLPGRRLRLRPQGDGRGTEAGHRRPLRRLDHAPGQGDAHHRRGHPGQEGDGDAPGAGPAGAGQPRLRHPQRDAGLPRRGRSRRRGAAGPEGPGCGDPLPGPALPAVPPGRLR